MKKISILCLAFVLIATFAKAQDTKIISPDGKLEVAVGVNAGESLGNTSKMTLAITTEKKEVANYQGGGGNDDAFEKFKSGTLSLSCRHVTLATLTKALGATAAAVAAGAVADEVHTVVALDTLIAGLNSTSTYLTQQLANLPSYNSSN